MEITVFPSKFEVFKENLTIFRNRLNARLSLVYWIKWYRDQVNPTASDSKEQSLFGIREQLDHDVLTWAMQLGRWIFYVSVTGSVLWFTVWNIGSIWNFAVPAHTILGLGLAWWVFTKFVHEVKARAV